jgi:hypothetical protein
MEYQAGFEVLETVAVLLPPVPPTGMVMVHKSSLLFHVYVVRLLEVTVVMIELT